MSNEPRGVEGFVVTDEFAFYRAEKDFVVYGHSPGELVWTVNPKQMHLFVPEPDKYRVNAMVNLAMDAAAYDKLRVDILNELAAIRGDNPFLVGYELGKALTNKFGFHISVVDNTDDALKVDE